MAVSRASSFLSHELLSPDILTRLLAVQDPGVTLAILRDQRIAARGDLTDVLYQSTQPLVRQSLLLDASVDLGSTPAANRLRELDAINAWYVLDVRRSERSLPARLVIPRLWAKTWLSVFPGPATVQLLSRLTLEKEETPMPDSAPSIGQVIIRRSEAQNLLPQSVASAAV